MLEFGIEIWGKGYFEFPHRFTIRTVEPTSVTETPYVTHIIQIGRSTYSANYLVINHHNQFPSCYVITLDVLHIHKLFSTIQRTYRSSYNGVAIPCVRTHYRPYRCWRVR